MIVLAWMQGSISTEEMVKMIELREQKERAGML
jgi:hypothetical protein